jgi:predicted ester cyclase
MTSTKEAADRHVKAFNDKNLEEFVGNESPDIEFVIPGGITLRGRDQVREYMKLFWSAFPDIKVEATYQVIAGDTAVTEQTFSGTHTGTLRTPKGDIAATGKRVQGRQVAVQRVKDGQVWSEHLYFDQMEFLSALGLVPNPTHA